MSEPSLLENASTAATLVTSLMQIFSHFNSEKDLTSKNTIDYIHYLDIYLNTKYLSFSKLIPLALKEQRNLEDIYYPLTLESTNSNEKDTIEKISKLDINTFFKKSSNILIEDSAGMGKSTLLKILFIDYFKNIKNQKKVEYIPFFIELRRYSKDESMEEFLLRHFLLLSNQDSLSNYEHIKTLFLNSKFIFFFDGFDEISPTKKTEILNEILRFTNKYSNNFYILSSRTEIGLDSFSTFYKYKIESLKFEEGMQLLKKYIAENKDKEFYRQLKSNRESLETFLETPLLASLIYRAYIYKQDIPTNKVDLYTRVYHALFEEHDANSKENFSRGGMISKITLDNFLNEFAFKNWKSLNVEYDEFDFLENLKVIIQNHNIPLEPFHLSKILTEKTCLFGTNGNQYFWSHKSMQEYFIAKKINTHKKKEEIIDILLKNASKYINVLSFLYELETTLVRSKIYKTLLDEFNMYKNYPENIQAGLFRNGFFYIFFHTKNTTTIRNINIDIHDILGEKLKKDVNENLYVFRSCYGGNGLFIGFIEDKKNISNLLNLLKNKKDTIISPKTKKYAGLSRLDTTLIKPDKFYSLTDCLEMLNKNKNKSNLNDFIYNLSYYCNVFDSKIGEIDKTLLETEYNKLRKLLDDENNIDF